MNLPKTIKLDICRMAKHHKIANEADKRIKTWLIKNNLYNYFVIDQIIDGCEVGYDPNAVLKFFEDIDDNEYAKGNDNEYCKDWELDDFEQPEH